jgi:hypothetical protein
MVRTFWIGAASLATICSLATAKFVAGAPSVVSASMQDAPDYSRAPIGLASQQDTLSKADKLPVGSDNEQPERSSEALPLQPIQQRAIASPARNMTVAPVKRSPEPAPRIISRHWHDPNAIVMNRSKSAPRGSRSSQAASKTNDHAERVQVMTAAVTP